MTLTHRQAESIRAGVTLCFVSAVGNPGVTLYAAVLSLPIFSIFDNMKIAACLNNEFLHCIDESAKQ